jgi:hypothetical protein
VLSFRGVLRVDRGSQRVISLSVAPQPAQKFALLPQRPDIVRISVIPQPLDREVVQAERFLGLLESLMELAERQHAAPAVAMSLRRKYRSHRLQNCARFVKSIQTKECASSIQIERRLLMSIRSSSH